MKLTSVYESLEYESRKSLRKYGKQLRKINEIGITYKKMTDVQLKQAYHDYLDSIECFDVLNKKHVQHIFALAREVTFRLTGKFQYDVQVLGGLAALERNMIQMSTGSGKTLTLILPVVAFGLTHKGVQVLTVNDYLSERDWEETKPIYDWFELSNQYTTHDADDSLQREAFECDITYCTNSTLGFAYLNSALASDIGQDVKVIHRPLFAAIIDEADEILMDDARNPLIIANATDVSDEFETVEYNGELLSVQSIVDTLKTLSNMGYEEDSGGQIFLNDKSINEIQHKLSIGNDLFSNPKLMHIIYSATNAIFQYRAYTDYIVQEKPDPDTGSRIVLIDKATGRLSHGRTLSDNMHVFLEMKEGVFNGQSNDSSIQITYQTLFNLFTTIAGVSGTLGTSYMEFMDIYHTGVVLIPDRLPNQLRQLTHLYTTQVALYDDLIQKTKLYIASHHPVLIGATSDIGVDMISHVLSQAGITHATLVSTDKNEDAIISKAGKPGSVVVTTDIMGRGTDIHVEDVEGERGLVVLQIGMRPNSRVERQFAGRAARQGQPGRYHRMLTLSELNEIGVNETNLSMFASMLRGNRDIIAHYGYDLFLNGRNADYSDYVSIIDDALVASESAYSTGRIEDFRAYSITDLIQTSLLVEMDEYRLAIRQSMSGGGDALINAVAKLSLPVGQRKPKRIAENKMRVEAMNPDDLQKRLFKFVSTIVDDLVPQLRKFSDNAINTTKLAGQVKYDKKPEDMMLILIQEFLSEHADYFVLKLDDTVEL